MLNAHIILILAIIFSVQAQNQSTPSPTIPITSNPSPTTSGATLPSFPVQTFVPNACTQCTYASIPKEPTCAALVPVDSQQLMSAFTINTININTILTAAQNPTIKNCVCHWVTETYNETMSGAAATCLTTNPNVPGPIPSALSSATAEAIAPCNATQASQNQITFSLLAAMIHCDAIVSHGTGRPKSADPVSSFASVTEKGWIDVLVSFGVLLTVFIAI